MMVGSGIEAAREINVASCDPLPNSKGQQDERKFSQKQKNAS